MIHEDWICAIIPMGHWGQATLRPRRWGQRQWGQTTLRPDDVEARRRWGQICMSNFPKPKHWPQRRDFEANVWPQSRDFQANAITEFNRIFSSSRSHIFNLLFFCGIKFFLNISFQGTWSKCNDYLCNCVFCICYTVIS